MMGQTAGVGALVAFACVLALWVILGARKPVRPKAVEPPPYVPPIPKSIEDRWADLHKLHGLTPVGHINHLLRDVDNRLKALESAPGHSQQKEG